MQSMTRSNQIRYCWSTQVGQDIDTLETKTQLLSSDAETATFSGKLSWGIEAFFCIKTRTEETLTDVASMTKALDMDPLYSIDGVSVNKIAAYEIVVQDKAGSVQGPYLISVR